MHRRDFLLLRTTPRRREFELSCERLYMRCLDAQLTPPPTDESADPMEASLWGGEPPAKFTGYSREQLFDDLDRELREVEVLKVVNSHWLVGDLRQDFERLMDGFRARGGRIQIQS